MRSFACIFPGQGSQEVGMAGPLLANPLSARVFSEANDALGFDLTGLIMNGPAEELTLTFNAQPAILTTSLAIWAHLNKALGQDGVPSFVAGHSLGEFSALTAAGSLDLRDAVRLVRKRGELMQTAVPAGTGTMAALIGGSDEDARSLVESAAGGEVLDVANFNAPGQVVISGHAGAVERAVQKSKEFGFKKAVPLNVSAPFHSKLMEPVRTAFTEVLLKYDFSTPICPIVHNVTAQANFDKTKLREMLAMQIDSPVRWVESVEFMIRNGVEVFIEVGNGSVLQGLVKKIAGREWGGEIVGCARPEDVAGVMAVVGSVPAERS